MRSPALLPALVLALVVAPGIARAQAVDSAAIARELDGTPTRTAASIPDRSREVA